MNVRRALLVVIASCTIAPRVHAASGSFGLQGGMTTPLGDLANHVHTGFHLGISGELPLGELNALGIDGNVHGFGQRRESTQPGTLTATLEERVTMIEGVFFARLALPPAPARIQPFLKAGMGVDFVLHEVTLGSGIASKHDESDEARFGVVGGLGASFSFHERSGLRLEALVHAAIAEQTDSWFSLGLTWWTSAGR